VNFTTEWTSAKKSHCSGELEFLESHQNTFDEWLYSPKLSFPLFLIRTLPLRIAFPRGLPGPRKIEIPSRG